MKISIITAVYNNRESILESIQSVYNQTYHDIEHIVIDGASTDGTSVLIESLEQMPSVFVSEPDKGIYDALNKGIRLATGDIIGFMHSDDLFGSTDAIQIIVDAFDSLTDSVYGDLQYVRKDNPNSVVRNWESSAFELAKLKRGWMPPHPTVYLRREIYEKYGLFDTSFRIAADYDFMLRIFSDGTRTAKHIPQVIVKMRVGGESNSVKNYVRKWKEDYRALKKNNIGGIYSLLIKNVSKLTQFISA